MAQVDRDVLPSQEVKDSSSPVVYSAICFDKIQVMAADVALLATQLGVFGYLFHDHLVCLVSARAWTIRGRLFR